MFPQQNRNAHAAEIQEDVSRDEIVSAFRSAMAGHFRAHVPGTNINESTLLSSDYLDHFNELVMLFETLATEPEGFAEHLRAWKPLTYEERFSQSGFQGEPLAVAAYRRAPPEARALFDDAVARLQGEALSLVARVGAKLGTGQILEGACKEAVRRLRVLIAEANAIAGGELPARAAASRAEGDRDGQTAVHRLFGKNLARFDP